MRRTPRVTENSGRIQGMSGDKRRKREKDEKEKRKKIKKDREKIKIEME